MKRTAFSLLSMGAAALLAAGCGSSANELGMDAKLLVDFGDGETSISLRGVDVRQTRAGTEITAAVGADMPDLYTFRVTVQSPKIFTAVIDNGAEISHQVTLNERELDIEFLRPTWERRESVGFLNAEVMNSWLQERIDDGSADCAELPARFRDMPLQYVTTAVLNHLVATRGVDVDVTRMQRVLCARAGDDAGDSGLDYPQGLAGWHALIEGRYLPPELGQELSASEQTPQTATGPTEIQPKHRCPTESTSESMASTYDTLSGGDATTNVDVVCDDALLDVDANCCVDAALESNSFGVLKKATAINSPFCSGVAGDAGPTQYAEFRFAAHANICPNAPNSCWSDGRSDIAKPFTCTFSGYSNAADYPFEPTIGGGELRESGIAGWNYLQFRVSTCYEPGTDADTLYAHTLSVDTNRPDKLICSEGNTGDCYCGDGP